ncbi:MAG: ankyrin repeat domain-containing protein, partial [Planctomycetota bacterium]|nr:ankyrin repeat domain-containing protein [Planctomycetota bacterium]
VNAKRPRGQSLLHSAVYGGRKEIAELLLANGADVNAKDRYGYTPLHFAALEGRKEIVEVLIENEADLNAQAILGTPLHHASNSGHKEVVELLLAKGADVNAKNKGDATPLDYAETNNFEPPEVKAARKEIADLLRKHGGKTKKELNVLFDASSTGNLEAAKQAIADGADVNAKNYVKRTPLHFADNKEIAELLITKGADVNAKDDWGETPLHTAAARGHKEIVELLINNGADMNVKDEDGETPLDWAIRGKQAEIADLLRKHGGKTREELEALMPRLTYSRGLFDFSFTAKDGMTYVVEVTQDFKQWGELETINGTGKQFEFIDPRHPLVPFKRNFYRVKLVE